MCTGVAANLSQTAVGEPALAVGKRLAYTCTGVSVRFVAGLERTPKFPVWFLISVDCVNERKYTRLSGESQQLEFQ